MATLAGSLRVLFMEIDARWPKRDRRTDGWLGDRAHQQTQSDHNPDSRGIVHAIDIDKDGIIPGVILAATCRMDKPTSYVIWNRKIYNRNRDFESRNYTGSNPHTDHIHVSIQYGERWEHNGWRWGIADIEAGIPPSQGFGQVGEMSEWRGYFDGMAYDFGTTGTFLDDTTRAINSLMR